MKIAVFGGCRILGGAEQRDLTVEVGAKKQRAIVSALALTPGQPVSDEALIDLVWADDPPGSPLTSLYSYVSALRKALDPERARAAPSLLETTDHGYLLRVAPDDVDTHRFTRLVRQHQPQMEALWRIFLGEATVNAGDHTEVPAAVEHLSEALDSWVGEPYADLPAQSQVIAERVSLASLRAAAVEARLTGMVAVGETAEVLGITQAEIEQRSLDERLWAIHALALHRAGRQVDALASLRQIRGNLREQLGLEPGQRLRSLEVAILRQDPALTARLSDAGGRRPSRQPSRSRESAARSRERAQLATLLDEAAQGSFRVASIVGEPGIGKSWLVERTIEAARERGFRVAMGAGSPVEGASPLWPWLSILAQLTGVRPSLDELMVDSQEADELTSRPAELAFRIADSIARRVLAAAGRQPVLLILEDAHWADDASLRALIHLVSVADSGARLAVVITRRSLPEPAGSLAELLSAAVRRNVVPIQVRGLSLEEAGRLVSAVAGKVPRETVRRWWRGSGGNPFFLIEFARLDPDARDELPATTRTVIRRRLSPLGPQARSVLDAAAVTGDRFRPALLAAVTGLDGDLVDECVDEAVGLGLVIDRGDGWLTFSHALVRDYVDDALPRSARSRLHARFADVLANHPGTQELYGPVELETERVRHLLSAGGEHARGAWPLVREAAERARRSSAFSAAMELRSAALKAHRSLGLNAAAERYDMALELARDAAAAANWDVVVEGAFEAITIARELGDPDRVARAAATLTWDCVWQPHEWDEVFPDIIDHLRWGLTEVGEADSMSRCWLSLSLAVELYYDAPAHDELDRLVDEGLAIARRLGDPKLTWWACRAASQAWQRPSTLQRRLELEKAGLEAARGEGDPLAEAISLLAVAACELEFGHHRAWLAYSRAARELAISKRLVYVEFCLAWLELNLALMRWDIPAARRHIAVLRRLMGIVAVPNLDGLQTILAVLQAMAEERLPHVVADLMNSLAAPHLRPYVHAFVGRADAGDEAVRRCLAEFPYVERMECWQTSAAAAFEAEAASYAGDQELAQHYLGVLLPLSGRLAMAVPRLVVGPVDGFIALALATLGRDEDAWRYAERATAQAKELGLGGYAKWMGEQLERMEIERPNGSASALGFNG